MDTHYYDGLWSDYYQTLKAGFKPVLSFSKCLEEINAYEPKLKVVSDLLHDNYDSINKVDLGIVSELMTSLYSSL